MHNDENESLRIGRGDRLSARWAQYGREYHGL